MIWLFVDADGIVRRIVKRQYLVFGFLHENVQPNRQVGADHMHKSELGQHPMPRHSHLLLQREQMIVKYCLKFPINLWTTYIWKKYAALYKQFHRSIHFARTKRIVQFNTIMVLLKNVYGIGQYTYYMIIINISVSQIHCQTLIETSKLL